MSRTSYLNLCNNIKSLFANSPTNLESFCRDVTSLSFNKTNRLVLNSMDSMLDSINIPSSGDYFDRIKVATSLASVPRVVYLPKRSEYGSNSNLSELLKDSLGDLRNPESKYEDLISFFSVLKNTAQFVVENGLHYKYGPMRPFLVEFLKEVQKELIETDVLSNSQKISVLLKLFDLMKTNSIDPSKFFEKIRRMIFHSDYPMNELSAESISYMARADMFDTYKFQLFKHIKSRVFGSLPSVIKHSKIVFSNSKEIPSIETYLYALHHKLVRENCETEDLLYLLRSLRTLSSRHNDSHITFLTHQLLEIIFPKLTKSFSLNKPGSKSLVDGTNSLDGEDLLLIFGTYINIFGSTNNILYKSFQDTLLTYILENKSSFTPFQMISIINHLNENISGLLAKGLPISSLQIRDNLMDRKELSRDLTEYLVNQLSSFEAENLTEFLNSLSIEKFLDLYVLLCKYIYNGEGWVLTENSKRKVNEMLDLVKRRILENIEYIKANGNLYLYRMAKIMVYEDSELNSRINRSFPKLAMKILLNQKVELLVSINKNTNLNGDFMNRLLKNFHSMAEYVGKPEVLSTVISNNFVINDGKLTNKLFSIMNYNCVKSKRGFKQLLHYSPYIPVDNTFLMNSIMNYLNRHVLSLSIYDAEALLKTMSRFNTLNKSAINNLVLLLNFLHDLNLSNTHNYMLLNILSYLKNLRVRHDPLIRKFTDSLLMKFKTPGNFNVSDLISLNEFLSGLSVSYNDMNMYLVNYLAVNAGVQNGYQVSNSSTKDPFTYSMNNFNDLDLRDKINLLHSIANFGIVDKNLKTLFLSVIDQAFDSNNSSEELSTDEGSSDKVEGSRSGVEDSTLKAGKLSEKEKSNGKENGSSSSKWMVKEKVVKEKKVVNNPLNKDKDEELFMKLYEIHIDLVVNGQYLNEVESVGKKLESTSKLWFMKEELKSHNFRRSNEYIEVKRVLDKLNLKFESGVTEVYFCNFVLRDRPRPTVLYIVPDEEVLRLWTTSLDPKNLILDPISIGNSQKVIKNLKLSGYQVVELFQSKWDSLDSDKADYLQSLLSSG